MELEPSKDRTVSSRNWGSRHYTPSGLCGNKQSAGDWLAERIKRKSPLGSPKGDEEPSDPVLLQGGHEISPSKIVDLKRSIMGRLGSRQYQLLIELAGDNIGDEREWELIDELEAIRDQREVIRSIKFD